MTYSEIIRELIKDEEYANYLCEQDPNRLNLDELICGAPISIMRKIELLDWCCPPNGK